MFGEKILIQLQQEMLRLQLKEANQALIEGKLIHNQEALIMPSL